MFATLRGRRHSVTTAVSDTFLPRPTAFVTDTTRPDTDIVQALDELADSFASERHIPGMAYGWVRDGTLVSSGGVGEHAVGGSRPDANTVFRIASMTKSFTAAMVLRLRDAGSLALDDPIAAHVPELAGLRVPTADSPPITIRHLLTMSSGLTSDDAWADRHLDATADELDTYLGASPTFSLPPGVAFRYSNLGYAALGRAVANITGSSCQQAITTELLGPLGMSQTGWTSPGDTVRRVARGYLWRDDTWAHDGPALADGAIAPMGGLWSTVSDLTRWVRFFADAFPPRDDVDAGPLCRASRREMQQIHRTTTPSLAHTDDGSVQYTSGGYGFGLGVNDDQMLGRVVGHSGGLPGYGSHMAWLPDHGIGVIALANARYARMRDFCVAALRVLKVHGAIGPPPQLSSPTLAALASELVALINGWDDERAQRIFADNVLLDEPAARRRAAAHQLTERIGPSTMTDLIIEDLTSATFTLKGPRGSATVIFDLSPIPPARLQFYEISDA